MRWLSLHLPHLALEVFARAEAGDRPLVVTAGHGGRQWVHARNRAAARTGIEPGMPLGTAQARVRDLAVRPRDPAAERTALEGVADWAGQFTSYLSLLPPCDLLLEARGSLKLFGGAVPFRDAVHAGLHEIGYRGRPGMAPTPLAAWLLARADDPKPVPDLPALEQRLAPLPLALLDLDTATLEALHGLGLTRIGECLDLPRAGLTRRLGPTLLDRLDRALGRSPDPRPAYRPPAQYHRHLPLPAETADSEALLFAARRLLLELAGFLRARRAGVQQLALHLHPPRGDSMHLTMGLVAPGRDPDHLLGLLRTRLERFPLAAPVEALTLVADTPLPIAEVQANLLGIPACQETACRRRPRDGRPALGPTAAHRGEDAAPTASPQHEPPADRDESTWQGLIERLRARLGPEAVYGCRPVADHRPERAWRTESPVDSGSARPPAGDTPRFGARPIWLLETPRPLDEISGHPHHDGALHLLSGPERIEAAWWEAGGVTRDYYVAADRHGARLWVFRERRPPRRWFLHGLFA